MTDWIDEPILLLRDGESLKRLAAELVRENPGISSEEMLEILARNNSLVRDLPELAPGSPLCVASKPLPEQALAQWRLGRDLGLLALTRDRELAMVAREEPALLEPFARFRAHSQSEGWITGGRAAQVLGYGATGMSAYAGVAKRQLDQMSVLARQLYDDVILHFRKQAGGPFGVSRSQLPALERYLREHPLYRELRRSLDQLPAMLRNKLGAVDLRRRHFGNADFFRRQFIVPGGVRNAGAHLSRVSNLLTGQIQRFGSLARGATWAIPAILGIYSTATAPEGQRLRTGLEESVGIVLGAMGTSFGGAAAAGAVGIIASVVVLPGTVIFVGSCIGAALGGYVGYDVGKSMTRSVYEWVESALGSSVDWFVEVLP